VYFRSHNFSIFCVIFVTLDSFFGDLFCCYLLLYRLGKSISFSWFKLKNCKTAKSCIFVHIILRECKMWPKFICTFFPFATKFVIFAWNSGCWSFSAKYLSDLCLNLSGKTCFNFGCWMWPKFICTFVPFATKFQQILS
jgi:hypothetical protein